VWRVVRTFDEALCAAETLASDGLVEKIWVLGGAAVYQVTALGGLQQHAWQLA